MKRFSNVLVSLLMSALTLPMVEDASGREMSYLESERYYQYHTKRVVKHALTNTFKHVTRSERKIIKEIIVKVPRSGWANAVARVRNDKREIILPTGLVHLIESVAYLIVGTIGDRTIEDAPTGIKPCVLEYLKAIHSVVKKNDLSRRYNVRKAKLDPPSIFIQKNSDICDVISIKREWNKKDVKEEISVMVETSIVFILGHEIAHHVLDHLEDDDIDCETARENEEEADKWAFKRIGYVGLSPLSTMPIYAVLGALAGGDTLETEEWSTHPAPERRMVNVLHADAEWFAEMLDRLGSNDRLEELLEMKEDLAVQGDELLERGITLTSELGYDDGQCVIKK